MTDAPKGSKNDSRTLQVRKIGNSIGFILPKETAVRLDLKEGDQLFLVDQPDGGIVLTRNDPDFERTMEIARKLMDKCRDPRWSVPSTNGPTSRLRSPNWRRPMPLGSPKTTPLSTATSASPSWP